MWTIIKSVLRFFKYSKLSMIGLFLLIFFSSAIFTLLNTTTTNLQNSYNNISQNGNLHDFVINEHFSLGYANYQVKYINKQETSNKKTATFEFYPSGVLDKTTGNANFDNIDWTNSYLNVYNQKKDDANYFNTYVQFKQQFEVTNVEYNNLNKPNSVVDNLPASVVTYLNKKRTELTDYTSTAITEIFDDILINQEKLPIEYRRFKSLDVNNTQQKMFFKVVESSPEYTIDKIVYYGGNQLTQITNYYDYLFGELNYEMLQEDKATAEQKELVKIKTTELVKYLSKSTWTQTTAQEQFSSFNEYLINNPSFNPYFDKITDNGSTISKAQNKTKEFIDSIFNPNYKGKYSVLDKGYQIRFSYEENLIPVSGYIDDFSSYQMVISPYYASKLNKKPISIEEWNKHVGDSQKEFIQFIKGLPDENKVMIDAIEYVVMGLGVSPDFMYPILSFQNLVPNKEKEQVVYANPNGYEKIYDAFRGNNTENFVVGKYLKDINSSQKQLTLDKINEISRKYMSWPANIDAAYAFDSQENTLTPASLRVQFIPQTVSTTNVVSLFMTTFVLLLSVFVSIIIIKRFIETSRNSLGIMQASGYRKREIISAINILISIPTIIAAVVGYIVGFSLQNVAIGVLGNFWTIPTTFSAFSFIYLVLIVIGLSALFILVSTLFSWLSLRGETSEFMKDDAKYKMSRITRLMKLPFAKFHILVRFRAAIAFSSLWRLITLSVMSALLMISLTFSFAVLNKYETAASDSFAPRNYVYQMNLITPTVQAGQYYAVPYDKQGMTLKDEVYFNRISYNVEDLRNNKEATISPWYSDNTYKSFFTNNKNAELKDIMDTYGNYQLVSFKDSFDMSQDVFYTRNKTSSKAFIDHFVGLGQLAANPWLLAESMMPPNNSNYANSSYNQLFSKAYQDNDSNLKVVLNNNPGQPTKEYYSYRELLEYFTKESDGSSSSSFQDGGYKESIDDNGQIVQIPTYREFDSSKTVNQLFINDIFLTFLYDLYNNPNYKEYSYSINYNKIVVNPTDEPYSYMDFNIVGINGNKVNILDNLIATGISQNSKRLNLTNSLNKNINYTLNEEGYIPLIINEFAKKKYNLNIGDQITVEVNNSVDRYSRQLHGVDTKVTTTLKVAEIANTYQGSEFFMSQYDVNKILGLDINNFKAIVPTDSSMIGNTVVYDLKEQQLPSKSEFITDRSGFNGIFTTDKNSLVEITNGVSLYAPSGLYPAIDKFVSSPTLNKIVDYKGNKEIIANTIGDLEITNKATEQIIQQIAQIFGESTQFTIVSQATSKDALLTVFNSVTNTTSNIQTVVLSIIIIVSLIIVVIISGIIINDSIKLAAILKCLGLRDSRNARTFLAVYFPVLLLGLIIAIPFSYLTNYIYVNVIFSFAGILLTIPMVWWHYLLSTFAIIAIFLFSYWIAWYRIHYIDLTKAIK